MTTWQLLRCGSASKPPQRMRHKIEQQHASRVALAENVLASYQEDDQGSMLATVYQTLKSCAEVPKSRRAIPRSFL
nr:hypothetical protein CFP56_22161 [Quercus suber]